MKPYNTNPGDVVINEIFANPAGSASLPAKEFIELWNTTDEYILTQGWKYADQTSTYTFVGDTLMPKSYVILSAKADTSLFKNYGKTIGISPWPSLNNDQDVLTLTNERGIVIDRVAYQDYWYKDELKKKGGFSLELIDPKNICKGSQNWRATKSIKGGTPGEENAVFHSQITTEAPRLLNAIFTDSVTIALEFSKVMDSLAAVQVQNYEVNNGIGTPLRVEISSTFSAVTLTFKSEIARGIAHSLSIKKLTDCGGNSLSIPASEVNLFRAKKILKGNLLISEVLFNPRSNGADFVEIYNNTDHSLDLKDLQIANLDIKGNIANIKSISTTSLLLRPKTYWVITSNAENIKQQYFVQNPSHFSQINTLPAFNNEKGTVVLLSDNFVIDRLDYVAKLHHPLIQNEDGISIERVSFGIETNNPGNFKSAAASVGFATPTYKNSQEKNESEDQVELKTKSFSPDGDGFEDLLMLEYQFKENASLATVSIYSDKGILIKKLLKNQTIGTTGSIFWDGFNESGTPAKIGIYVVLFDLFNLNGNTKRFKKTCVLAGKLN